MMATVIYKDLGDIVVVLVIYGRTAKLSALRQ